ncbi:hypothetical protein ELY21_02340 [Legionella sp. km535]|uniref:YcaO-like family protein n=1 Tax=Legionella sp. km535 TaxID=2498107 RepID=UPI000F8DFD76|nr:YcaO-like family protein [Legionella sp. km535]RUR19917.1 hypothetical protein ELY21_02340 [Legionella sp. km535]
MLRTIPASETLGNLLSQLNKYGITRIADLTYLNNSTSIYVYSAMRPSAKSLTTSMGKGLTIEDAKCSALMESIETFYAEEVIPDIINASFKQLATSNYRVLKANQLTGAASISEDFPIDWCFGNLLNSKKKILIPHCLLSLDSNRVVNKLVGQNSNGLASGNSFEESLICSFWELNERQSINNDKSFLKVDSEYVLPYVGNEVSTNFFLYKSAFDIPVIGCYIKNINPLDNNKIFAGYGSHRNMAYAMQRALFEAIQSKIGIISGVRDDINDDCYLFTSKHEVIESYHLNKMIPLDPIFTALSVLEEYDNIRNILSHFKKDLAYYCYVQDKITVLKSFLVDLC